MAKIIAMQDIRTSLANIADEVEKGERFIVVRNSRPAFQLAPLEESRVARTAKRVMTLAEMRARFDASPVDSRELRRDELDEIIHEVHRGEAG